MARKSNVAGVPARGRMWRRVGFRAAAAALAVGVGLLAVEGVFRVLRLAPEIRPIEVSGESPRYRWSENPILGYELRPDVRQDPKTNSHGFADVERTAAKPAGVRRVVLLGDSVVEGAIGGRNRMGVDDLMSQQLEKLYPDGRRQVLNLGVSGYCTLAEVELLRVRGLAFAPDEVVLVFVENDFCSWNMDVVGRTPPPAAVRWLFRSSHLFRYAALRTDWMGIASAADPQERNMNALGADNVVRGLALLRKLSLQHRFTPRIAIWPAFTGEGVRDLRPLDEQTLIVEALAAGEGIATARLSAFFRKHFAALGESLVNPRRDYTFEGDGMHPNPAGCQLAARALKAMLDAPPDPQPISGQKVQAARQVARAIGESSHNAASRLLFLGDEAVRSGDREAAIAHYRRALELADSSGLTDLSNGIRARLARLGTK